MELQWMVTDLNITGNLFKEYKDYAKINSINSTHIEIQTESEKSTLLIEKMTIELPNGNRYGIHDRNIHDLKPGTPMDGAKIFYQGSPFLMQYFDWSSNPILQGFTMLESSVADILLGAPDSFSENQILESIVSNPTACLEDLSAQEFYSLFHSTNGIDIEDDVYGLSRISYDNRMELITTVDSFYITQATESLLLREENIGCGLGQKLDPLNNLDSLFSIGCQIIPIFDNKLDVLKVESTGIASKEFMEISKGKIEFSLRTEESSDNCYVRLKNDHNNDIISMKSWNGKWTIQDGVEDFKTEVPSNIFAQFKFEWNSTLKTVSVAIKNEITQEYNVLYSSIINPNGVCSILFGSSDQSDLYVDSISSPGWIQLGMQSQILYTRKPIEQTDILKRIDYNQFNGYPGGFFSYNNTVFRWDGTQLFYDRNPTLYDFSEFETLADWDSNNVVSHNISGLYGVAMLRDESVEDSSYIKKNLGNLDQTLISYSIGGDSVNTYREICFSDEFDSSQLKIYTKDGSWWVKNSYNEENTNIDVNEMNFQQFRIFFDLTNDKFFLTIDGQFIDSYDLYACSEFSTIKVSTSNTQYDCEIYLDELNVNRFKVCGEDTPFSWQPGGLYNQEFLGQDVTFNGVEFSYGMYWNGLYVDKDNYLSGIVLENGTISLFPFDNDSTLDDMDLLFSLGYCNGSNVNEHTYYHQYSCDEIGYFDGFKIINITETNITVNCFTNPIAQIYDADEDWYAFNKFFNEILDNEKLTLILDNQSIISSINTTGYKINGQWINESLLGKFFSKNTKFRFEVDGTDFMNEFISTIIYYEKNKPIQANPEYLNQNEFYSEIIITKTLNLPENFEGEGYTNTKAILLVERITDYNKNDGSLEYKQKLTVDSLPINLSLHKYGNSTLLKISSSSTNWPIDYKEYSMKNGNNRHNFIYLEHTTIIEQVGHTDSNGRTLYCIEPNLMFNIIKTMHDNRYEDVRIGDIYWERYSSSPIDRMYEFLVEYLFELCALIKTLKKLDGQVLGTHWFRKGFTFDSNDVTRISWNGRVRVPDRFFPPNKHYLNLFNKRISEIYGNRPSFKQEINRFEKMKEMLESLQLFRNKGDQKLLHDELKTPHTRTHPMVTNCLTKDIVKYHNDPTYAVVTELRGKYYLRPTGTVYYSGYCELCKSFTDNLEFSHIFSQAYYRLQAEWGAYVDDSENARAFCTECHKLWHDVIFNPNVQKIYFSIDEQQYSRGFASLEELQKYRGGAFYQYLLNHAKQFFDIIIPTSEVLSEVISDDSSYNNELKKFTEHLISAFIVGEFINYPKNLRIADFTARSAHNIINKAILDKSFDKLRSKIDYFSSRLEREIERPYIKPDLKVVKTIVDNWKISRENLAKFDDMTFKARIVFRGGQHLIKETF